MIRSAGGETLGSTGEGEVQGSWVWWYRFSGAARGQSGLRVHMYVV